LNHELGNEYEVDKKNGSNFDQKKLSKCFVLAAWPFFIRPSAES